MRAALLAASILAGCGSSGAVHVAYHPLTAERTPRPARAPGVVREQAILPASHVALGDVVATCDDGCDQGLVRGALFAEAGQAGATDVVAIACVHRGDGYLCTGRAAGPEVDPELDRRSR